MINAALAYDCIFTHETYTLFILNALHIKSMHHHIIPQFIMREAGLKVDDTPKIHCTDPSIDGHCISFKYTDLRCLLQLNDIFSYFDTRKPLPSKSMVKIKCLSRLI